MKPYPHDLRVRILDYSLMHTAKATAAVFQVGINTRATSLKITTPSTRI